MSSCKFAGRGTLTFSPATKNKIFIFKTKVVRSTRKRVSNFCSYRITIITSANLSVRTRVSCCCYSGVIITDRVSIKNGLFGDLLPPPPLDYPTHRFGLQVHTGLGLSGAKCMGVQTLDTNIVIQY